MLRLSSALGPNSSRPEAQPTMWPSANSATVTETPGSHSVYLSPPQVVANLVKQAASR
jgi:hypothetical protein